MIELHLDGAAALSERLRSVNPLAVIDIRPDGLVLVELADDVGVDDVLTATGAPLDVSAIRVDGIRVDGIRIEERSRA